MSFLIYTSKMSWNIYYKYVANAPENETQFPRGEHPGPCLFLPLSVVVSSPPPPPPHRIPNLAPWSLPTGNSYSFHTLP